MKPNLEIIKEIITVGLPSFLRLSSGSIATLLVNQSLRFYGGDLAIIILGVVIKITRFLFMPMFGVVQGMQPIAGYNYGARQYDGVLGIKVNYKSIVNYVILNLSAYDNMAG